VLEKAKETISVFGLISNKFLLNHIQESNVDFVENSIYAAHEILNSDTAFLSLVVRSCTMRSFIICTHPQISLGKSSQGE
jgi:hypothetical protein